MKRLAIVGAFVCLHAGMYSIQAAPILVTGSSTFTGGILGAWSHTFSTGSPDVEIQQIKIILRPGLFFDTSGAAPGFLTNQNVATSNLGGTGFTGFSASGNGLNGGTMVTLSFNDFGPGETYVHVGDVDQALALQNCSGLTGAAAVLCGLANTAITTDASIVTGAEFEGSQIEVTIGGATYSTLVLTATFARTGAFDATANWSGTVVPEPSTFALAGAGIALAAWTRRRRTTAKAGN